MIENDDKTFTATETLALFKTLKLPMVLDVHHHNCNNKGEKIEDLLEEIMATWDNEHLPPKFHFSSPKEAPRSKTLRFYSSRRLYILYRNLQNTIGILM